MTKTNSQQTLAPLDKNIDDVGMIEAAIAEGRSVSSHQLALVDQFRKAQIVTPTVEPENIAQCMTAAVALMASMFHEPVEKQRGDNGRLYAIDRELPDGVGETGEIVQVERYDFLIRDFAGVLPWKCESKIVKLNELIATARAEIRDALQNDVNGTVNVDIKSRYLESLIDQRTFVEVAFEAACTAYADVTGRSYETKAMREQAKLTRRAQVRKASNPALERARALGVDV
jgi:hypothetical protein